MIQWDEKLKLLTPAEFNRLPDGIVLTSINGNLHIKGISPIDMDTRGGVLAYGIQELEKYHDQEYVTAINLILSK